MRLERRPGGTLFKSVNPLESLMNVYFESVFREENDKRQKRRKRRDEREGGYILTLSRVVFG